MLRARRTAGAKWLGLVMLGGLLAMSLGLSLASSCASPEGCLGGDDGECIPPSPCTAIAYQCSDPGLELRRARGFADRPPGLDALAARGDVLIGNSRVLAVIDAIGAPHQLAHSGGNLLDLVPRGGGRGMGNDELNQILHTVGILPDDQAQYRSLELLDQSPELVAVIARGRLAGRPDVDIVTRYEVRPCEPGIRVRTELYHGGRDPEAFMLSDAYWWGDREVTPFVPLSGQGFVQPDLDIMELGDYLFEVPYMAAQSHTPGGASYGTVRCDEPLAEAFQSVVISAAGKHRKVLLPGDSIKLERFIAVAHGPGLSGAANHCLEARAMIFGDSSVMVRGRAVLPGGTAVGGDERLVSLLFYEPAASGLPDDPDGRTPFNEAVPAADGSFEVRLPAGRRYRVQAHVMGRPLPVDVEFAVDASDVTIADVVVPPTGVVDVRVSDSSGQPVIAEVVLTPTSPTDPEAVRGTVHGQFDEDECVPYLGPPHGGSPACNRVLVDASGTASFAAPAGRFYVYATRGPFATIDREVIEVVAGESTSAELTVDLIADLVPPGVIAADFHVHAGASFDSSFPERDRALTFVSAGIDVLAATDHDVVTTYAAAIADLGIGDQVLVMPGVETTGQILFHEPPGSELPQVIGHFNFWPLRADYDRPRNGAPDDELVEPGELFDRIEPLFDGPGVIQLNHPFADTVYGRDEGFWTAIKYDPRVPVPLVADITHAGQLRRRPGGGHSNMDHHAQEVMNGTSTLSFLKFRAGWHSFLSQGYLKAGTANSDTHSMGVEVLGYPRNLVFGGHSLVDFDRSRFNADVRDGRMVGTNGPVLLVSLDGADGSRHEPSLSSFEPAADAALHVEVRAAPWIPVEEIRVIVNGRVARQIADGIAKPDDPWTADGLLRYEGSLPLDELLLAAGATGDAWIVVEAGMPLWPAGDVDDDGLVDTTDNNGDGRYDAADQTGLDEDDYYRGPPDPEEGEPRYHLHVIAPGTYPASFSNPMLVDRAGDGWTAPGLP
ncbi:MAG: PHP domain-containing protein [Deltaproteobacteria bacterium]|nr:PHP domain-containing protein [Deltaproteobacteria bacterium]